MPAALNVRVVPRAARTELAGRHGGGVKVRLTAPPVEGAANAALVDFLAKVFGVKRADVTIASGEKGREKVTSRQTMEVLSLGNKNLPASFFDIPAGYEEKQMGFSGDEE